jgi:hypothetical protein
VGRSLESGEREREREKEERRKKRERRMEGVDEDGREGNGW